MRKEELLRKVQEDRKYNKAVLAPVNSKYHHYFLPIERSIANYTINLNDELKRLGYYTFKPKTRT